MEYSKEIATTVENFLKADQWTYDFDENLGVYESGVVIKNQLEYAHMVIFIRENCYTVYMDLDVLVPEEKRIDLAKWLTETNCGMIIGSFEMDYNRGTLRFKCTVDCEGTLPGFDIIRNSIYTGILMLTEYGDNIIEILK